MAHFLFDATSWTNDWAPLLEEELTKPYFIELSRLLADEYREHQVYPPKQDVWQAIRLTSYADTKVVILGQDPYHGPGQAHGLAFSVRPGIAKPPSLLNMMKELQADLGCPIPRDGTLVRWAEQGVLLLNTVLTVRNNEPQAHQGLGWEIFTDRIMKELNQHEKPIVFILWGSHAQRKAKLISHERHLLIQSPHPSPLSAYRGFFGSRPYSRANEFLRSAGMDEIDWNLFDG